MKYTENGLRISLKELRELLERAENNAERHNMNYSLYIQNGANNEPQIIQYCSYAECNPTNYTLGVTRE